jgi:hypothetical protein
MRRNVTGWSAAALVGAAILSGCAESNESSVSSGTVQPKVPEGSQPSNSMGDFGKAMQKKGGMTGANYPGAPKASKAADAPAPTK